MSGEKEAKIVNSLSMSVSESDADASDSTSSNDTTISGEERQQINTNTNTKNNASSNNETNKSHLNSSFQEFFEQEASLEFEQMTEVERKRQLDQLLMEEDDSIMSINDSSREVIIGGEAVGGGFDNVELHGANTGGVVQDAEKYAIADKDVDVNVNDAEVAKMIILQDEPVHESFPQKSADASYSSSSSSSSSSGSSTTDSSNQGPSFDDPGKQKQDEQEQEQEQLSIPIAISTSRSEEHISAFDKAMTDVIHSGKGGTVTYNGLQGMEELNSQAPSPLLSPASTTIQQVLTMDEDNDGVETFLEISLSLSQSATMGKSGDEGDHGDTGTRGGVDPSLASQASVKSLAQQIKQSIDQTPSKPLPRTVQPNTSLPTLRPMPMSSAPTTIRPKSNDLSSGSLPDVLTTVRDKIDGLFDSERRAEWKDEDEQAQQNRENLRRAFQQSVSAAVLVSLAHKRYERRRLAAMEIEKVVRTLVQSRELDRVKGILLLLSDDYVRSTNEDARKGGVVAMAACAIGLKKAHDMPGLAEKTNECTDLILASVVHACQDNSQRVRYYATESLFNVIKVLPGLAVEHFFILFEILRSLWADVDVDVRSGAELLDKKLQGIIIGSINSGQFDADACVPLFARFLHMRNKPTKRLTLTWLQAFAENLIGAPLLEFLHLFLTDVFAMLADPNSNIRQIALLFLNSMLPKLLMKNEDFDDAGTYNKVDFDKILQSLVTTMEHPDPFVRKVAMFWVSRIVQAHMGDDKLQDARLNQADSSNGMKRSQSNPHLHAASVSVRNALEHVLPGLLLSIGDTFQTRATVKDTFLPDQTTHYLADQTNRCLQNNVRKEGRSYIPHLGGFVVALREELDTPGGLSGKNRSAKERKPYRMDVKPDGSGIESTGWFRAHEEGGAEGEAMGHENILSRLCALEWIVILFECVVPESLKDEVSVLSSQNRNPIP